MATRIFGETPNMLQVAKNNKGNDGGCRGANKGRERLRTVTNYENCERKIARYSDSRMLVPADEKAN